MKKPEYFYCLFFEKVFSGTELGGTGSKALKTGFISFDLSSLEKGC